MEELVCEKGLAQKLKKANSGIHYTLVLVF
jgi:hypothetical protein